MSEWWTYSLSDFLMFAPRTYYRLFERYNADLWPAQVLALVAGVAVLVLSIRRGATSGRALAAILALAWAWVAWAYFRQRYATINWAAGYFAAAFAVQALLLAAFVVRRDGLASIRSASVLASRAGFALSGFAVAAYPLIAVLAGRGIAAAEVFGLAPDPTVLATLGVLLHTPPGGRWVLLLIPLAWCAASGATLWTMGAPEWWLLPLLGVLALAAATIAARSTGRRRTPS